MLGLVIAAPLRRQAFEPFKSGYDPGHPVDQAIMATRRAVFPPARA